MAAKPQIWSYFNSPKTLTYKLVAQFVLNLRLLLNFIWFTVLYHCCELIDEGIKSLLTFAQIIPMIVSPMPDIIRDGSFLDDCRHIEKLGVSPFSCRYLDRPQAP